MEKVPKTDFPSELVSPFKNFQDSLDKVGKIFNTFRSETLADLISRNELDALSKAKLDCLSAYAMNSLVWIWLKTKGMNPKEVGILDEIDRVRKTMKRLKEVQESLIIGSQADKNPIQDTLTNPKDLTKADLMRVAFDSTP